MRIDGSEKMSNIVRHIQTLLINNTQYEEIINAFPKSIRITFRKALIHRIECKLNRRRRS